MPGEPAPGDAFGRALLDHLEHGPEGWGHVVGRPPGQLRLSTRRTNLAGPWYDYLFVPVEELSALAGEAGGRLVEHQPGPGPYLAILELP